MSDDDAPDKDQAPADQPAGRPATPRGTGPQTFQGLGSLRQALTGRDSGPEMAVLLPLIGRGEAVSRLRAKLKTW